MENIPKEESSTSFKGDFIAKQEVKTEAVKTDIQVWNEYFTAFVLFPVQQGQYFTLKDMDILIKTSASTADKMLDAYQIRAEALNGK